VLARALIIIVGLFAGCRYMDAEGVIDGAHRVIALPDDQSFDGELVAHDGTFALATRSRLDASGSLYVGSDDTATLVASFSSYPRGLASLEGTLLFVAAGAAGSGIWASDGTPAGTRLVKTLPFELSGAARANISAHALRGRYYVLIAGEQGALWASDGSAEATVQLYSGYARAPVEVADGVVFLSTYTTPTTLWQTDGTIAGTRAVTMVPEPNCQNLVTMGSYTYVSCGDTRLWRTDGTRDGTLLIADHAPLHVATLQTMSEAYYYVHTAPTVVKTLWRTAGVPGDSAQVIDHEIDSNTVEVAGRDGLDLVFTSEEIIWARRHVDGSFEQLDDTRPLNGLNAMDDLVLFHCNVGRTKEVCALDSEGTLSSTRSAPDVQLDSHRDVFVRIGNAVYFDVVRDGGDRSDLWVVPFQNLRGSR
jgi:ELWxxDGT repeat protein